MQSEQTLILVDEHDRFEGYLSREECHKGNGRRHRAIAVILHDRVGRILLQKRKSKLWDSYWDVAGATHPLHLGDKDETYGESAIRFLKDEWNVAVPVKELFAFNYFERFGEDCENEYCMILAGECGTDIEFNSEFAYDKRWIGFRECLTQVREHPGSFTPWAVLSIENAARHPYFSVWM